MENEYFQLPEDLKRKPPRRGIDTIRDDSRDAARINSDILNSARLRPGDVHAPMLGDAKFLAGLKSELRGDENGFYFRNQIRQMAVIPGLLEKLRGIDERAAAHKQQRTDQGYSESESMPPEMAAERSKLLGVLDTRLEELRDIERRLKVFTDAKQEASDSMMLCYGLRSMGKLKGGTLAEIDFQKVSRTPEGILVISDSRSPYCGLSVTDYRKLSAAWLESRRQADRDRLAALQLECKSKGLFIPKNLPVSGCKKVARASLPGFPPDAVNWLALDKLGHEKK